MAVRLERLQKLADVSCFRGRAKAFEEITVCGDRGRVRAVIEAVK